MTHQYKNVKLVYDPLWGLIDITNFIPLIDTPQFQALGFKNQLGVTSMLFPAASHTRKQHSLGAFKRTQELSLRWEAKGFINKDQARQIEAYALFHDIGHGPFSHVVEEVTKELWNRDHDQNGVAIVDKLRQAIETTGINFKDFRKLFTHENPLYLAVHDKNLGTEKLDYLSRDAYYTLGEKPGVEYLANHTYFIDNKLAVDEKAIDNAKALQEFYVKMYKMVYLRKNSAIAQRLVQRIVYEMLQHEKISEDDFWSLTDFGLLGRMENSKNPDVYNQTQLLLQRKLPKVAAGLKLTQFADMEIRKDKAQTILPITESQMTALLESPYMNTPSKLHKLEEEIAKGNNMPKGSVLIAPSSSAARFVPKDINIYIPGGQMASLSDYFEDHFRAIEEEGKSYSVIRVCTFQEYRKKLSEPKAAENIKDYLLSLLD